MHLRTRFVLIAAFLPSASVGGCCTFPDCNGEAGTGRRLCRDDAAVVVFDAALSEDERLALVAPCA